MKTIKAVFTLILITVFSCNTLNYNFTVNAAGKNASYYLRNYETTW